MGNLAAMPRRIAYQADPAKRGRHFIKEWRKAFGLSQELLGQLIGETTTKSSISRLEDFSLPYHQDILEAIARLFHTHPANLLTRRPRPEEVFDLGARPLTAPRPKPTRRPS